MIKINNHIILEIDGKFFNTFETNINKVDNINKKKYKNVTKTILKLQDIYGLETEVNYILNEKKDKDKDKDKDTDNQLNGGKKATTKNIIINKKFLDGGG
tara:strand:- start:10716 stop:11015 length:300 start_codon:yes stop_codon:yes gene_type:complete